MKFKKILSFFLAVLFACSLLPLYALADGTVTVSENPSGSMLEHFSGGLWYDMDLPNYTLSDGSTAYALDLSADAPGDAAYVSTALRSAYPETAASGLEIILENGYPGNVPSGMTNEEARQATAAAIFFFLSEQGFSGSSTYANRRADPSLIRAKSGHDTVLSFADSLLALARGQKHMQHGISFSEDPVNLAKDNPCSGSVNVTLSNCAGGYTVQNPSLGAASVTGSTGHSGDTLSLTAPSANGGTSYTVDFTALDARVPENVRLFTSSGKRNLLAFRNENRTAAQKTLTVNIPGEGMIRITKYSASYQKTAGATYGIYKDEACTDAAASVTTGSTGTVTSSALPVGTYYVRETAVPSPMVLEDTVHTVRVQHGTTQSVVFTGTNASAKVEIRHSAQVITSLSSSNTSYGRLYTPVLENGGLAGVTYELRDAGGELVSALTTDKNGFVEAGNLAFGNYTLKETSVPDGYEADPQEKSFTLSYKDSATPVVVKNITASSVRLPASVKLKKLTERFDPDSKQFEEVPGANFIFGLYTADGIGVIGKDTLVDILTTDENGEAESDAPLAFGSYYIRELAVPDSTIEIHGESFPLTVSGRNTDYCDSPVKNDMFKANIGVWLSDSSTGAKLSGGTFEVRDADNALFCTFTTDSTGYGLSASLPAGQYKLKEVSAPDGYILSASETDVTVTTQNKTSLVFEFTNAKNSYTLTRTDAVTGEPVPGVTVTVYKDGAVYRELVTGPDGTVILDGIPAGSYAYLDTEVPDGYTKKAQQEVFSVAESGVLTGTIETGTVQPSAMTLSVENLFTSSPFPGVEYAVLDENGDPIKTEAGTSGIRRVSENGSATFLSGQDGSVEIRYLPVGNYTLRETTPEGYISDAPFTFVVTNANTVSNPVAVVSSLNITGLEIYATDAASGNPLPDIGFSVKVKNGSGYEALKFSSQQDGSYILDENGTVDTLMADGSGRVTVYGLPLGDIWIEEAVHPDGYFPISAVKAEITSENTSESPGIVNVSSSKYIKLGLDSDWWEFPALILGLLLLLGGGIFLFVWLKKKKRREETIA